MISRSFWLTIWLIGLEWFADGGKQPEQIHLSLGTYETEMLVTWHTTVPIEDYSLVYYGLKSQNLNKWAWAEMVKFKDIVYTYRALMVGLKSGQIYYYKVGSKQSGWSIVYSFRTLLAGNDWNPTLCIFGDLGVQGKSISKLKQDAEQRLYDVMFHVGDFAYDLDTYNGERGNTFMREIEPIAARVPYMVCPGNHERAENFSHYDARFSMIGDRHNPHSRRWLKERLNNHYHSMDIGRVHVLMYSSEFYCSKDPEWGWDKIKRQFKFMERDLSEANRNRERTPWIVVMAHRPLYQFKVFDNGKDKLKTLRLGIYWKGTNERRYGLEELFRRFGVDLGFFGHDHFYIRMYPVYDRKLLWNENEGNNQFNYYDNPKSPVYFITGVAGKYEIMQYPWSVRNLVAFKSTEYGYTRLKVIDSKHILIEQLDLYGTVLDSVTIFKNQPKPNWFQSKTYDETDESIFSSDLFFICISIVTALTTLIVLCSIAVLFYKRRKRLINGQQRRKSLIIKDNNNQSSTVLSEIPTN